MSSITVNFNNENYVADYNEVTGYYELELKAPNSGGIYDVEVKAIDIFGNVCVENAEVQVWNKEKIKIETNKIFMWILDYRDLEVKDVVEISNYELSIDEETNATSTIEILKKTTAKAGDIIVFKKNNEILYWGEIKEISNDDGNLLCKYDIKYITNIFDRDIKLTDEELIKTKGIEDFIAKAITDNFISSDDNFINKNYLELEIKTHTKKQTSVSNVQNGIYNLHTWITNCTQNYDITYSFSIKNKKLVMTIENKQNKKEFIDTNAHAISNYSEVFETSVMAKVTVLTSTNPYTLYLLNDRTTTTDKNNINRAEGEITTVYTEKYEDAHQKALDTIKSNSYNHKITFNLYKKFIKVGTPIAIKTKESIIHNTYISAMKISDGNFIEYTCGNIRTNFIDKLLKERKK